MLGLLALVHSRELTLRGILCRCVFISWTIQASQEFKPALALVPFVHLKFWEILMGVGGRCSGYRGLVISQGVPRMWDSGRRWRLYYDFQEMLNQILGSAERLRFLRPPSQYFSSYRDRGNDSWLEKIKACRAGRGVKVKEPESQICVQMIWRHIAHKVLRNTVFWNKRSLCYTFLWRCRFRLKTNQ